MIEFLHFAFAPANAAFSILLSVVLLYWLVVAVGLLNTDFLDFDLDVDSDLDLDASGNGGIDMDVDADMDMDVDGDVDVDAHMDAQAHVHASVGMGGVLMAFFYLGRVPLTVLITILVFSTWILSMLLHNAFNPSATLGPAGLALMVLCLLGGLVAVKVVGWPFALLYKAMHANPGQIRNVKGKICVMLGSASPGRIGQAEVRTDGAPVVVNVMVDSDQELARGQEAVILRHEKKGNVFVIAPVDSKAKNGKK